MIYKKKGFTLVELLAVMVILSLILVLVAPNVLNSMNMSKKNAMIIYAKKMISLSKENIENNRVINEIPSNDVIYSLYNVKQAPAGAYARLTSENTQYRGCVKVSNALTTNPTYKVYLVDNQNGYKIVGLEYKDLNSTSVIQKETTVYKYDKDVCP